MSLLQMFLLTPRCSKPWVAALLLSMFFTKLIAFETLTPLYSTTKVAEWKASLTTQKACSPANKHNNPMKGRDASKRYWKEDVNNIDYHGIFANNGRRQLTNASMSFEAMDVEVLALLALKEGIKVDASNIMVNWTYENRFERCTTWVGVTCNSKKEVVEIDLSGHFRFSGTITPMIGNLSQLRVLVITNSEHDNYGLDGNIPPTLGQLIHLQHLDLSGNKLNGTIPLSLRNCSNLQYLNLSLNYELNGGPNSLDILSNLFKHSTQLKYLDLSGTCMQEIPASLEHCLNLQLLDLSHNYLDGTIPSNIFVGMTQLQYLDLSYNSLVGMIPQSLKKCVNLQHLDLSYNTLNGTIPSYVFVGMTKIVHLDLRSNYFFDMTILQSLEKCVYLQYLDFSFNSLNGSIPMNLFGELTQLQHLDLKSTSYLTGTLPQSLKIWVNLQYLDVSANMLNGSISSDLFSSLTKLQYLDLSSNSLMGMIPQSLENCTKLQTLDFSSNMLSNEIPSDLFSRLTQLQLLALHENNLNGMIPSSMGNCYNLQYIYLNNNSFTGLPSHIFDNFTNLEYVDISYNKIMGNIPNGFGSLEQLEQVYLQHNMFTGLLPDSLGHCSNMISIDFSDNAIYSTIPTTYGNLYQLTFLNLSYNNLVGHMPLEFANLTSLTCLQLSSNNLSGPLPPCATLLQDINLSHNRFNSGVHLLSHGDFNNLYNLDVSNNKLGDNVATFLSQLRRCPNLRHLNFGKNLLVGPMKFDFGMFPYLKYFGASNNNISGHIPSSFAKSECGLELMDLSHNQISGVISAHINNSHLSDLRVLKLSYNNLQGPIPSWIGALETLQVLDLSHNNFTGSIPSNIDELDNFKVRTNIRGTSTDLTGEPFCTLTQTLELNKGGPVPISYTYVLATLVYFDLSSNMLNGSISPAFAQLVGLDYLNLSQNKFQGEIPQDIGDNLTSLEFLDLSSNNLTGTIPSSMANIQDLQFLNVSLNNLSGEIPTSRQFNTFNITSYLPGNHYLCGDIINKMHPWCVNRPFNASKSYTNQKQFFGDEASLFGFFIGMALGASLVVYAVAVWNPTHNFVFHPEQKDARRKSINYGMWRTRA